MAREERTRALSTIFSSIVVVTAQIHAPLPDLEGDILVGDFRCAAGRSATSTVRIVSRRGAAFEVIAPASAGTSTFAGPSTGRGSAFGAATQHAEVAGDNLKAGALLTFFVLPFAGLDAPFDEDQRTLLKILLSNFSLFAPHDDLVPLGPLLALAVFVFVRLIGGNGEICDGLAAAGVAGFGIAAQTADENDFIDGHERIPPSGSEDTMRGRKREIKAKTKNRTAPSKAVKSQTQTELTIKRSQPNVPPFVLLNGRILPWTERKT